MCLLSEGIATHAGLPWELSGIQMNVGGNNLYRDLAIIRAFRHNMLSKSLIVVPETFQHPPANLIAEQAHFARMAISAKLGGANFYRPKERRHPDRRLHGPGLLGYARRVPAHLQPRH